MRETQRAYSEGYAPPCHCQEGSTFRAPARRVPPTPYRPAKRRATARAGSAAPYWWAFGLLVVLWGLGAAVGLWLRDERAVVAEAYCAGVYAGKVPDWRGTYFEQCSGPALKKPRN